MYLRYRTRFAYKTCEKTGHVEEVESTQGDRHGAPGCICLCLYTVDLIRVNVRQQVLALAQTIQQPAISPWPMHHHLHTDTSTSFHLISVHSLTRSLACLSGLAVFFFLFLIFWFCYHHHHHFHHLRHPLAPVSRKIHQIINITIQILQSSNPLPTSYYPPATIPLPSHSHTSHLTPHTANHKPASSPQLRSLPRKSSPESPNPGPDPGALCALRTASPSLTTLEARDTRRAPAWAACYPRPVLELRS